MESQLGKCFREARKALGLGTGRLASLIGYRNLSKGACRIQSLEAGGPIQADLLYRLADVLGIDHGTVQELIELDHRAFVEGWTMWANEPVRPFVGMRASPAVHGGVPVPDHVQTIVEAINFAASLCRRYHYPASLVASRRFKIWLAKDGTIETVTEERPCKAAPPYIGNTTAQVDLGSNMILPFITWPKKGETQQ